MFGWILDEISGTSGAFSLVLGQQGLLLVRSGQALEPHNRENGERPQKLPGNF